MADALEMRRRGRRLLEEYLDSADGTVMRLEYEGIMVGMRDGGVPG